MPMAFRHRLRVLRRVAWYALAVALVCVALVLGVVSQLLPLAERHPDKVAAWLSQRAGRPVTFRTLKTEWTRRGPLLRLDGLQVGGSGAGQGVQIGQGEVLVALYSGLLPGRAFTELRLRNIALEAVRAEDGSWAIRGFPGQQKPGGDPLQALDGLGELQVVGGRLRVLAPSLGWDLQLPSIDLRLRVQGPQVRAGARLRGSRQGGRPIGIAVRFDRHSGDGRAYLQGQGITLSDWQALSGLAGMHLRQGRGDVQAWAQLKGYRVQQVQTALALKQVQLGAHDGSGTVAFAELSGRGRYQRQSEQWRLDVPRLQLGTEGGSGSIEGLRLVGGARSMLVADRIEVAPLLQALAMSEQVKPGLRAWLRQARPQAVLRQVQVTGALPGPVSLTAQLQDAGFAPVGQAPGLSGLAGHLSGDTQGVALVLDETAPFRFDWPAGFGVVHSASLRGTLAGWREGAGWKFGTPALRVVGPDLGLDVRGDVWFQDDASRPWLNLAAEVHDTPLTAARGFWVRHRMSKAALDWLNMALQGGTLRNGTGLVAGDLDHWPFLHNQGLFDAGADIAGGRIRFQPDWPDMQGVDAHVRFVNNGFQLSGKGRLGQVPVRRIEAGIADWHQTVLKVDAAGGDDAGGLLSLVRSSPLQQRYGSAIKGLSASGPATVDYRMQLPLRAGSGVERQITGQVALDGARLTDRTWDLDFSQVRGAASFSDGGFQAPALSVNTGGQPGQLALRAGTSTQEPAHVFEAQLQAPLTSDELLQRVPEIGWLKAYLHGRSPWTVKVGVGAPAQAGADPPVRISAASNLVGTTLNLPAPLAKSARQALPASVDVQLPLEGGRADVSFGTLMALRAQQRGGSTGVRVEMGRSSIAQPVPDSGFSAGGTAASLDAAGWIAVARASGSAPADATLVKAATAAAALTNPQAVVDPAAAAGSQPLQLRGVDITAQKLLLIGGAFPATRVQVVPAPQALEVKLDGAALSGSVHVPEDENAPVRGRLARLHWVSAAPPPAADTGSTPAEDELDPSALPSLALDVDDLRVGQASLGQTTLRTRKLPSGLRVDTLRMRSPQQKLDINGDWTGRGRSARTHLVVKVDSQDLGALMDGLGFTGRVRGGTGKVELDLAWPSSPADFSLGGLDGSARLDAHDGALLEVEPGAGRVLGLFSLTQLPRRLMLDFRDFFSKGFAFNRIEGDVAFTDGRARTDNTVIEGPAAQILISGSTDLGKQTFDQTIHVLPRSGNLLTMVGAFTGGPVGAAVGAAANAMLGKPLGEIGAKTYHVTGPWKDPKVDVTEHDGGAAPPAVPQPAPAPAGQAP